PKVAEPRNEITKKLLTKRREKFCVRALQSALSAVDEWFWSKTKQSGACVIWIGPTRTDRRGMTYGYVYDRDTKKRESAHRVAWRLHHGPIPPGMCVCHRCDVPLCVLDGHLFLGTRRENNQDCARKGRYRQGERHWKAKLTERDVRFIRRLAKLGAKRKAIGALFGVSHETIKAILSGRTWKNGRFDRWAKVKKTGEP